MFRNCTLVSEKRFLSQFLRPLSNEKCLNTESFISKKYYRQRFFRSENSKFKKPPFFELWTDELAIWFYRFLNRSLKLSADENSDKIPISNFKFSIKVPIFETYHKT